MKVLVLGGTQFIGRHLVEMLIAQKHEVTLLNRGKTAPQLFPQLSLIKADRQAEALRDLPSLRQDWDAIIDLCAYYPKEVSMLLEIIKGRAGRYIFCSTISAYAALSLDSPTPLLEETSPLHECTKEQATDTSMLTYGQRKAECERVAFQQHSSGVPTIAIRPSIVYGAHDHTDRFAYWIWRASSDKSFLLPDDGLTITTKTYAPDLASAFVAALTSRSALGNAYNIAETEPMSLRDTLYHIGNHLGKKPLERANSVSSSLLLAEKVKPWADLPLWIPRTHLLIDTHRSRRDLSFVSTPTAKALANATDAFLGENRTPKTGLSQGAEAELINKLKI